MHRRLEQMLYVLDLSGLPTQKEIEAQKKLRSGLKELQKKYPLKRACTVEEIANIALFFASEASSYINGQCLVVDGGRYILGA